jgi:hypothetical protein
MGRLLPRALGQLDGELCGAPAPGWGRVAESQVPPCKCIDSPGQALAT